LSVMGAFAEFERALILERQREGIAAAKQRGAYTGRNPPSPPNRPASCGSAPPPASGNPRWPPNLASAAKPSTATCGPQALRVSPAEPGAELAEVVAGGSAVGFGGAASCVQSRLRQVIADSLANSGG